MTYFLESSTLTLKPSACIFEPSLIHRPITLLFIAVLLGLLIGCGGGGGSSSGTPPSDTTAPTKPSLLATAIAQNNVTTYNVRLSSAEVGSTASWSFSDSLNSVINGTMNVGSSTLFISNSDLSSLADGTITFEIFLTDAAGNRSDAASITIEKDTLAPLNYSVSSAITEIDTNNQTNFTFTINTTSENIGAKYDYIIEDINGLLISGNGTINSINESTQGINVSSLNPGSIIISVSLSDDKNNSGDSVVLTIPKTSAGSNVVLSGTITFDFVPHNMLTSGLSYNSTTAKPARGIEVQLLDANDSILQTSVTDSSGNYSFGIGAGIDVRVRAFAKLFSTNGPTWDFRVTDNTSGNALYVMQGVIANTGTGDSTRNLHASSGWTGFGYTQPRTAAPFAILDTIYDAVQLIVSADANVSFPSSEIRWSINNTSASGNYANGDIGTSFYSFEEGNIYLLGAANNDTDEYDRHVIAHEWCHYFTDQLSRSNNLGGSHFFGDRLDMRVAFGEGFCNAFSSMAANDPVYRDSSGNAQASGFDFDLEDNNVSNKGWYSEGSIGSVLYDIFDTTNEGIDDISESFQPFYNVLISADYKTADAFSSIHLFLTELKKQFALDTPSTNTTIDNLTSSQNFTVNDGLGTGETNNASDNRVLPIYHQAIVGDPPIVVCSINNFGTRNKLGNIPLVIFTTPSFASRTITVTRESGDANSDPDLVLSRNGVAIAISELLTANTETWTGNLQQDTYVIDVYEASNIFSDTGTDVCFNVQVN